MLIEKVRFFIEEIVKKKEYVITTTIMSILAYSFSIFNRTISMDDFSYVVFLGENHLDIAGFRWSEEILQILMCQDNIYPLIGRLTSVVFLILTSIFMSFVLYTETNNKSVWSYAIFSSIFITYPLINELFEFNNYPQMAFGFLLISISLAYQCAIGNNSIKTIIISGCILAPAMAGYESVMFAYVTMVFIILYSRNRLFKTNWFREGLLFSLPLIVSLFLRYSVGLIIILLLDVDFTSVGNATIKWFTMPFSNCLMNVLYNGWYYGVRALSYLPISEFVVALFLFVIITIKNIRKENNLIVAFFMLLSLFFLSFLQGEHLHYRNAQTIQLFVSYVPFLLLQEIKDVNSNLYKLIVVFLIFICYRQSIYLENLLSLNNLRSENESFIFRKIGSDIYSKYDKEKTVVFCGEYQLGSYIEDQITVKENSIAEYIENIVRNITGKEEGRLYQEYVCTNVNSYYNTQKDAFNGQLMIKYYMSYLGYDINVLSNLSDEEEEYLKYEYEKIAVKEDMKTYEIKDMGNYILVYLGPTIDGINND